MNRVSPRRIVSLQPSVTLTLAGIGALDRLVACTRYCGDVCPEVRELDIPVVSDSWTARADQIMQVGPDLVIASVPYQLETVAEILKCGIRFLGSAPRKLADIYLDIATISGIVDEADKGTVLIAQMQSVINEITEKCTSLKPQRVFTEEWGKPIIASQPWVAELILACNAEFIGKPGMQTDADSVASDDPDVILAAWCGAGDRVPLEKIVTERGWTKTKAATSRRVFCIADELLNTPAHTLLGGLYAIAWALHPNDFDQPRGIRRIAASVG